MSPEHLRMFRAHCLNMHGGMPDQTVVIDVIDGLLALREMGGPELTRDHGPDTRHGHASGSQCHDSAGRVRDQKPPKWETRPAQ